MAIDGLTHVPDEPDEPERIPARPASKSLDETGSARDAPDAVTVSRSSHELPSGNDPEKAGLIRAIGELASEIADLYKKVNDLTDAFKQQSAALNQEKVRFSVWAREVSAREEAATRRMGELELRLAERLPEGGPGEPRVRVDDQRSSEGEEVTEHQRGSPRDTAIAVGAGVLGASVTGLGYALGSTAALDTTGLLGWGATISASVVAWIREYRRDKDADRSHG